MLARTLGYAVAHGAEPRAAQGGHRIAGADAGLGEPFARQIEAANVGILVEIAQDIGELQRASEMMGELDTVLAVETEHSYRQSSDSACHPVAIEVECGKSGRADVLDRVHLHAVDDRQRSPLGQTEVAHRPGEAGDERADFALKERAHLRPPLIELSLSLRPRAARVRDIVDASAETVD